MAQALLVTIDFPAGLKVVEALERAALPMKVALWLYFDEYEEWRMAFASPRLDKAGGEAKAYRLVREALEAEGITVERTPTFIIMSMSDPFIKELRRLYAKNPDVEGKRLSTQMIGGRWVEDSILDRVR